MNTPVKIRFLSLALILLGFLSCKSSKELIYLNDLADGQKTEPLTEKIPEILIKKGDMLYISVKSSNPDINTLFNPEEGSLAQASTSYQKFTTPSGAYLYGFEVNPTGEVILPIIGNVKVIGVTQQKAQELVQEKANIFLKEGIVKLKLLNFKVTILGEVRNPGVYYNYNNTFTILEAMAMANGNTDYSNLNKVMIVRPGEKGNTSYLLDLSTKNSYLSDAFFLQPNDYIFVQPGKYKTLQLNAQLFSLMFSSLSLLLTALILFK